jgi:hypothetical protein
MASLGATTHHSTYSVDDNFMRMPSGLPPLDPDLLHLMDEHAETQNPVLPRDPALDDADTFEESLDHDHDKASTSGLSQRMAIKPGLLRAAASGMSQEQHTENRNPTSRYFKRIARAISNRRPSLLLAALSGALLFSSLYYWPNETYNGPSFAAWGLFILICVCIWWGSSRLTRIGIWFTLRYFSPEDYEEKCLMATLLELNKHHIK